MAGLNFRWLAEYFSRGIVLKRRLPAEFENRRIYVSPEGGGLRYFKYNLDTIDPMLLHVVRRYIQPGNTIWDIGGNLGFFAFTSVIQSKGGRVAVFEPDISLAYLLRKTCDANPDLQVDVFPFAVSDKDGIARFNIAQRARSTNFLEAAAGSSQTGGVRRTISVPTITLDSFLQWYPKPDFIKIDTEGAELLVLDGMTQILNSVRPIVLCEVSQTSREYAGQLFKKHHYQMFDAGALPEQKEVKTACDNIIAVPLEK